MQQKTVLLATLARLIGCPAEDLQEMTTEAAEAEINRVLENMK